MTYKASNEVVRLGSSWRKDISNLSLRKILKKFPNGAMWGAGGVYSRRDCGFVNDVTSEEFVVYSRCKETRIGAQKNVSNESVEDFAKWLTLQFTAEINGAINQHNAGLEDFRTYLKSYKGITLNTLDIENIDDRILDLLDNARALGYAQAVYNQK